MKIFIGVDPGLSGAIAAVSEDGAFVGVWDTPTQTVKSGKKNHTRYVPTQCADVLRGLTFQPGSTYAASLIVGLESVHAMPGQGVTSMFSMGRGVGMWEGIVAALSLRLEPVVPQRWKKELLTAGVGDDKSASIVRACELFPAASEFLKRKKDDGRAEALLIAEYTRRREIGGAK